MLENGADKRGNMTAAWIFFVSPYICCNWNKPIEIFAVINKVVQFRKQFPVRNLRPNFDKASSLIDFS